MVIVWIQLALGTSMISAMVVDMVIIPAGWRKCFFHISCYAFNIRSGSSSGGGGGGRGGSAENYSNIIFKEKYDVYIFKEVTTMYSFTNVNNTILYTNIMGSISAIF